MGRFLKIFFCVLGGGLALVAAINIVVDPYASFRFDEIAGFNDQKRLKRGGGRVSKSVILDRQSFDTVFLGTSTVETGLDPRGAALAKQSAYNAALPFSGIGEMHRVALYVSEHRVPKRIVIGLDFASFAAGRGTGGDYSESGFAGRSMAPIYLERIFSAQTLRDAAGTVRDSVRGKISPFSKYGNYDPNAAAARIDINGQFVSSLDAYLSTAYRNFRYDRANVDLLRDALARLVGKGTEVILFASPIHAVHLDAIGIAGLRGAFDDWKRDMAGLASEFDRSGQGSVSFWDFSDYNSVTSEPVALHPGDRMRWYWDAAHYTSATGDLILCRVLDCRDISVPADFGIRLDRSNIDGILAAQRRPSPGALASFSADLDRKARRLTEH